MHTSKPRFKFNKTIVGILHHAALFAMLNSTFVLPSKGIIEAWINKNITGTREYSNNSYSSYAGTGIPVVPKKGAGATEKVVIPARRATVAARPAGHIKSMNVFAGQEEGVIGVSKTNPLDSPSDNLFTLSIKEFPAGLTKAYLDYEVYGVAGTSGVARGINSRLSSGGHLVKIAQGWSKQHEEIDIDWLRQGTNTIMFTTATGATYQYKIKGVSIAFEKPGAGIPLLVVNSKDIFLSKDNKAYIKGFLRNSSADCKVYAGDTRLNLHDGEFEGFIDMADVKNKTKVIVVRAFDKEGLLGQEPLILDSAIPADYLLPIEEAVTTSALSFKAFTAGALNIEGASIDFNDAAMAEDLTLSVSSLRHVDIAPLEPGMVNVTKGGKGYRFLPDGTTFCKPVSISIAYDNALLPQGYTPKDIKTYFFDLASKHWKEVKKDSVDLAHTAIRSETTHFTDYINGIIQTPESPETSAFAPTMMSDIKAADPASEMTIISPPQASQTGDGNISYPIKIPAGRNGIQPNVSLNYSNNGGNGWLGEGWNVSAPAITIDTRWGVPIHDATNESEIYNLNGDELMYPNGYLPNRHNGTGYSITPQARGTATKVFSLRRQGSFTKVERYGASSSTYYWKVTDTNGTISWYGGKTAADITNGNAVIKDANGNIVHWALFSVEDVFGNNMKYSYNSPSLSGLAIQYSNLTNCKAFYLGKIQYTGSAGGSDYYYTIQFNLTTAIRPDVTINARLGLKQADPYLLDKIVVYYKTNVIRSYQLNYTTGKFNKTLLSSVAELDGANTEFYRHNFSYYDDIQTNNGNLFKPEQTINLPTVNSDYSLGFGDLINASKIGSTQNSDTGYSIKPSAGVEIWFKKTQKLKTLLVGAPFGKSTIRSKGKVELTDIDGDGLADIVFKSSGGLKYFPGLVGSDVNGNLVASFSPTQKSIHNVTDYNYNKLETNIIFGDSWDVSIGLGVGNAKFFAGTQHTTTKSDAKVFMTDANHDGLTDIVNGGSVQFNHIDPTTGEPTFTANSDVTPNMVITGTASVVGEPAVPVTEQPDPNIPQTFDDKYDVVRVWQAATDGTIQIPVKITNLGPGEADFTVERKFNGHSCTLKQQHITAGYTEFLITNNSTACDASQLLLKVTQGERIYFRLHRNATASNPDISFSTEVNYLALGTTPYPSTIPFPLGEKYQDSFVLSKDEPISFPGAGTVAITWTSFAPKYVKDAVKYGVYKRTVDAQGVTTDTAVQEWSCAQGSAATTIASSSLSSVSIDENTDLVFKVVSSTNVFVQGSQAATQNGNLVGWWRPKVVYTPTSAAVANGASSFQVYATPNYSIFHAQDYKGDYILKQASVDPTAPTWTVPTTSTSYGVKPNTTITTSGILTSTDNGSFLFAAKDTNGNVIGKKTVTITNGVISVSDTNPITIGTFAVSTTSSSFGPYKFEYYVDEDNIGVYEKYKSAVGLRTAVVGYGAWGTANINKTMAVSSYYNDLKQLGPMLNNWGQFLYNADFDTDTTTPTGPVGKLINDVLVVKPFNNSTAASSALANLPGCDATTMTAAQYQACYEQALMTKLSIPAQNADLSNTDVQGVITNIQGQTGDFTFNMPMIAMEPTIADTNTSNDEWIGIYGSQYSSPSKMRSGGPTDSSSGSTASGGGGGLSYADLSNEAEPVAIAGTGNTVMKAIDRIHTSAARSYSIGWGSYAYSHANAMYSHSTTDFIDVNGDGYPDIVTTDAIQKTSRTGAHLASVANPQAGNITNEGSNVNALVASRNYATPAKKFKLKSEASGNQAGKYEGSLQATIGVGVNVNFAGSNKVDDYWADLNGDGLPDRIRKATDNYKVIFNRGQNVFNDSFDVFSNTESMASSPTTISVNASVGGTSAIDNITAPVNNLPPTGFSVNAGANVGYSAAGGNTDVSFIDINGDGLADKISGAAVYFNNGTGFSNTATGLTSSTFALGLSLAVDSNSQSIGVTGFLGAFFGIPIFTGVYAKGGFTFDAHSDLSVSQNMRSFNDINGDGYADYLRYDNGVINVSYSAIGRTNMLKTVTNSLGGSFTMNYEAATKTYGDPNGKWRLKDLVMADGYNKVNDGYDTSYTKFVYDNGYYDRRERQFYGYETVKTLAYNLDAQGVPTTVYTTNVVKYHNQSYFLNGLVKEAYTLKGTDENAVFSRTLNTYVLKTLLTTGLVDLTSTPALTFDTGGTEGRMSAVALLTQTTNSIYELGTTPITSTVQMDYNSRARISKYYYKGNISDTSDDYTTEIQYQSTTTLDSHNLIDIPLSITVKDNAGVVKRLRTTTVLDQNTGTIGSIVTTLNSTETATTSMEYDLYGNLTKLTLPVNGNSQAMFYSYTYDSDIHKYVIGIQDAFTYTSSTTYDPWFDKVLVQTDITGNTTRYQYDTFGRLRKIIGPNEQLMGSAAYTIKMDYYPLYANLSGVVSINQADFTPVAVTSHFDLWNTVNDIQTYTFTDGFDRVIQVKKDIDLNGTENMSFSGKSTYDAFGRVIRQYHPYYEAKVATTNFKVNEYNCPYYADTQYDELSRVTKTSVLDDSGASNVTAETNITFSLDTSTYTHKTRTVTNMQASDNIITESYTDVNGRVVKTINVITAPTPQNLVTAFNYSSLGELNSYTDAESISTSYMYDLAGRKIQVTHPDNGITAYKYDLASNLISLQTANLVADNTVATANKFIKYGYNYNRLITVVYPPVNGGTNIANVDYHYGAVGSGNNTGRLIYQTDATGMQSFEYGTMGELIHNERTVVGPNIPTRIYTTDFDYDSFNRIRRIVYPDGEGVYYGYNMGGNLKTVFGTVAGQQYFYIADIQYDYYEQRTLLIYGNHTQTTYKYTPSVRRLNQMYATTATSEIMFNNKYTYDKVGNVRDLTSLTSPNSINGIGGEYSHQFYFDNMNRLNSTGGYFYGDDSQGDDGPTYYADYSALINYNASNGIVNKSNSTYNNQTEVENYDDAYQYFTGTHMLKRTTDANSSLVKNFDYDHNGNLKNTNDGTTNRDFIWDESNRLRVVTDPGHMQHYIYDASGERVLKAASHTASLYTNGTIVDQTGISFDAYTTYPSGYIVVKSDGEYTKHYYAGSQRIVSRIGEEDASIFDVTAQPRTALTSDSNSTEKPFEPDALRQLQIKDLTAMLAKAGKGTPSFKEYKAKDKEPDTADPEVAARQSSNSNQETDSMASTAAAPASQFPYSNIYFYHPDHLGTSTYLTDANGQPYQMFMNKPFGETLIEQHSLTEDYETPFKFNGKELDSETGLYYYGARYYDPRTSIWLSVDPLGEEFPNFNPYVYCFQNPINFTDPTGMEPDENIDPPKKNPRKADVRPEGMSEEESLSNVVTLNGKKYHKYTSNAAAQFGNWLNSIVGGDDDYFVEHKEYNPTDDEFIHEAFDQAAGELAGMYVFKYGGKLLSKVISPKTGKIVLKFCFIKGTLVYTDKGNVPIEDIKIGDLVWSYNENNHKQELKKVVSLSTNTAKEFVDIFINDIEILCTLDHPFYINDKWISAKDLNIGDMVTLSSGIKSSITQKNIINRDEKVYNFTVEDNHNYYVSESKVLVHNSCSWKTIIHPGTLEKTIEKQWGKKAVEAFDEAIEQLASGKAGKNIHPLGNKGSTNLAGYKAMDLAGSGSGRGAGRIIFRETAEEIEIIGVVKGHEYSKIIK